MTSDPERSQKDPRPAHGYRILRESDLRDYLAQLPSIAARSAERRPIGDRGGRRRQSQPRLQSGAPRRLAVKQALPYVRLVGESWPLPLSRAHYEHLALCSRPGSRPSWCPQCFTTTRRWP